MFLLQRIDDGDRQSFPHYYTLGIISMGFDNTLLKSML